MWLWTCALFCILQIFNSCKNRINKCNLCWQYVTQEHWCPVVNYEFTRKEGWKFVNTTTTDNVLHLNKILPDEEVEFKLRAKTIAGYAPFSTTIKTFSLYDNEGKISNLSACTLCLSGHLDSCRQLYRYLRQPQVVGFDEFQ